MENGDDSITSLLSRGQSRPIADHIVSMVSADPSLMPELMTCFFSEEMRVCQRAAWPVGIIAEKHPELLERYLAQMISNMNRAKHDAVIRNTLRTFQFIDVPEEVESDLYDRCLEYVMNPSYPIAFTAFAMTVCVNICMKYPELKEEVVTAIEYRMPEGSAGIRARGRKLLKQLSKI